MVQEYDTEKIAPKVGASLLFEYDKATRFTSSRWGAPSFLFLIEGSNMIVNNLLDSSPKDFAQFVDFGSITWFAVVDDLAVRQSIQKHKINGLQ